MTIEEVIEFYGSALKACEAIGFPKQNASTWKYRGAIPYFTQLRFEKASGGKLVAVEPKETNKIKEIIKINPLIFMYESEKFGLCFVKTLYFGKNGRLTIQFISDGIKVKSGFDIDKLYQATDKLDKNGDTIFIPVKEMIKQKGKK